MIDSIILWWSQWGIPQLVTIIMIFGLICALTDEFLKVRAERVCHKETLRQGKTINHRYQLELGRDGYLANLISMENSKNSHKPPADSIDQTWHCKYCRKPLLVKGDKQ